MKRLHICWKCLRTTFSKIHLVDKCLLLLMLVLMLQSAYSLFFQVGSGAESSDIDVIVRTSSAAIFGYFLSGNFIRHKPAGGSGNGKPAAAEDSGAVISTQPQNSQGEPCNRLQIMVATGIGLFCLVTLLLLRDVQAGDAGIAALDSVTATVAQFRDFVSGCVGFLIGCPTHHSDQRQ